MALNAYQKFLEAGKDRGLDWRKQPDFEKLIIQYFGEIPLPEGIDESQVVSRSPQVVQYKDAEGYVHRLERQTDGRAFNLGEVRESSTNRPAVLPASTQQQEATKTSLQQLMDLYQKQAITPTTPEFAQLDAQTRADLDAIALAENQALEQQFGQQSGNLIAQLYGQGIPQSSIASRAASDLAQGQGLVKTTAQGQQAQRGIDLRNILTQMGQQEGQFRQSSLQALVSDLLGQNLSRDVAGGQLGLQQKAQEEDVRRYNQQSFQEQLRYEEALRQQKRQNMWNNIFKGISVGTSVLGSLFGAGGLIGGAGAGAKTGTSVPTGFGPPT